MFAVHQLLLVGLLGLLSCDGGEARACRPALSRAELLGLPLQALALHSSALRARPSVAASEVHGNLALLREAYKVTEQLLFELIARPEQSAHIDGRVDVTFSITTVDGRTMTLRPTSTLLAVAHELGRLLEDAAAVVASYPHNP